MQRHLFVTLIALSLAGCMGGQAPRTTAPPPAPEPERSASTGGEGAPEHAELTQQDRELVRSVAGEWHLAQDDAEARIDRAISEVTGQMGFLARGIANGRIDEAVNPEERVTIEAVDAEHIAFGMGAGEPVRLELNGPAVSATGPDGQPVRKRAILRGERLTIEEQTAQGTRTLTFQRRGDGLVMTTRIHSDRLPDEIEFALRYRRGDGAVARG